MRFYSWSTHFITRNFVSNGLPYVQAITNKVSQYKWFSILDLSRTNPRNAYSQGKEDYHI